MVRIFWESTQKARQSYFCDRCCNWIGNGETYRRSLWAPHADRWYVLREHDVCPSNEFEVIEERINELATTYGVPLVLEVRLREVVVLSINGEPLIIHETEIFLATGAPGPGNLSDDDDVPF